MQELGMAGADERQHAKQERDRESALSEPSPRLAQHRLDLAEVVQRLGHDQVGSGGELLLQSVPLRLLVRGGRIERAHDREPRALADRRARLVLAPVQAAEDLDEPHGIDIPDACACRVIANPWRIAGERQDVADPEGMRAQELGLERHEVPVA